MRAGVILAVVLKSAVEALKTHSSVDWFLTPMRAEFDNFRLFFLLHFASNDCCVYVQNRNATFLPLQISYLQELLFICVHICLSIS